MSNFEWLYSGGGLNPPNDFRNSNSISQAFINLLDQKINIPRRLRIEASKSQLNLRALINSEHQKDPTFPLLLNNSDTDFLGGSFARHTKIKPLDDIDVYFPIDGASLFYTDDKTGEMFPVVTDEHSTSNPLLQSRWTMDTDVRKVSSTKLINGWASFLRKKYPNSKVKPDGQAISVLLSSVAIQSQNDPGLGFDVVPCFLIKPSPNFADNFYIIADGKDGWIRTNPKKDQAVNKLLHNTHNKTFRSTVKLMKYWASQELGGRLSSYFIELVVAKAFFSRNQTSILTIQEGLLLGFNALAHSLNPITPQLQWINNTPLVDAGNISQCDPSKVLTAANNAVDAFNSETH